MSQLFRFVTRTAACLVAVFVCLGAGLEVTIPIDRFVDRARFEQARSNKVTIDETKYKTVRGALVNHHALASDLLWKLFQRLATCRTGIERIVILSPDHYFQGQSTITTASVTFQRKTTRLTTDDSLVKRLLEKKVALSDPKLFRREHGVGALVPFMMDAFPKVQIVPIVIRADISQPEAERLATVLKDQLDQKTLLVVSSDMSHYLPQAVARKKDRETAIAFAEQNASFFWRAKDDHLDFGKGVWTALQVLSPSSFELLDQGNSVEYGGSAAYTTSYLTGFWR